MNNSVRYDLRQARVRIQNFKGGISAAVYSGMVDAESFEVLSLAAVKMAQSKHVLVIDTSKVFTTVDLSQEFTPAPNGLARLPGVVICREDQLVPWQRYAAKLAQYGVIRVVFLDSERAQALSLADFFALAAQPQGFDSQPDRKQLRA